MRSGRVVHGWSRIRHLALARVAEWARKFGSKVDDPLPGELLRMVSKPMSRRLAKKRLLGRKVVVAFIEKLKCFLETLSRFEGKLPDLDLVRFPRG